MGYPRLYNDKTEGVINCAMQPKQRERVNALVDNLNKALATEAAKQASIYAILKKELGGGILFANPNDPAAGDSSIHVPADRSFDDHRFCEQKNSAYLQWGLPASHPVAKRRYLGLRLFNGHVTSGRRRDAGHGGRGPDCALGLAREWRLSRTHSSALKILAIE
jgi:hypothetical protein